MVNEMETFLRIYEVLIVLHNDKINLFIFGALRRTQEYVTSTTTASIVWWVGTGQRQGKPMTIRKLLPHAWPERKTI